MKYAYMAWFENIKDWEISRENSNRIALNDYGWDASRDKYSEVKDS